ncbi:RNApolymerase sigma-subunit C isoform X2 [Carex rostrata]
MAVVPKCCACASHGPTSQLPKPHDQLFSTISLYGNTKSRTTALLLPEESKKLHLGSVKESSCSSTDAIKSKANFYSNSLHEESTSGSIQSGLLMENLNEIEGILANKELELLERDIVLQIKQLGPLKLYHDCLSQNLVSTPLKPDFLQLEVPVEKPKDKVVIVRSGRSQERKLKRIKASHKRVTETEPFASTPHTNFKKLQKCRQRILSFGWRSRNHCTAKEECEFSEGVKVASELERIREVIEKETGQPVSYADWAKAAKTDTGTLSQLLIHGQYCRDQLVQCTQPLVIFLVKKYRGLGIGPDDLVQAGNLGVLKGAEKFDSKKGYRFSTYIRHWIRKAIFEFIAQNSRIFRLSDIIPDKSLEGRSSINRKILNEELLFILEELNPREKQIIAQRYGLSDGTCRSLEEIGQHFNLSKEWIRKLEKRAIAKLRRDDIKDNVRRLLHWYN